MAEDNKVTHIESNALAHTSILLFLHFSRLNLQTTLLQCQSMLVMRISVLRHIRDSWMSWRSRGVQAISGRITVSERIPQKSQAMLIIHRYVIFLQCWFQMLAGCYLKSGPPKGITLRKLQHISRNCKTLQQIWPFPRRLKNTHPFIRCIHWEIGAFL